jgi:tRNA dimethylallyltransferase
MSFLARAWFLTGPTAAGKTAIGLALAEKIDAEIISMDSMAIYRELDIGTAKPTAEERKRVPHHLIDIVGPHEDFSLAQYVKAAETTVEDIKARSRQVLFVGGTPLYLKGLLRGIFKGPPADWQFRQSLLAKSEINDASCLHDRLKAIDPSTAARLHANDTRRIIRALEVFEKTGRPISELQQQFAKGQPAEACRVFVIDRPKHELRERIGRRVDAMFHAGLVGEVRCLLANSLGLSKTARQAVGYTEVIDYCEAKQDLAATVELVKLHTRQLAKRQGTWFRSLSECRFITIQTDEAPEEVAEKVLALGCQAL